MLAIHRLVREWFITRKNTKGANTRRSETQNSKEISYVDGLMELRMAGSVKILEFLELPKGYIVGQNKRRREEEKILRNQRINR